VAKIVKVEDENAISDAVRVLKNGGIIIYPTETSYGVGADALNEEAVEKVHKAKEQPHDKPISVIVAGEKQAEQVAYLNERSRELVHKFMPGPLTLISRHKEIVPANITTNGIAFRISSNEFASKLARSFGHAITATSANIHGKPAIYSAEEAIRVFGEKVNLIVDAGNMDKKPASTIYCTFSNILLRGGEIPKQELEKVLGKEIETGNKCEVAK